LLRVDEYDRVRLELTSHNTNLLRLHGSFGNYLLAAAGFIPRAVDAEAGQTRLILESLARQQPERLIVRAFHDGCTKFDKGALPGIFAAG
jgi:ABC-type Fe3+-citrate transport system substrate-binding protein